MSDDDDDKMSESDKADLVNMVRTRYEKGAGADSENRRLHTEDMSFIYDSENFGQWDPFVISMRQGRPCYTFNRVLQPVNMVLGDQRQCAPAIKVRPIKDGSQAVAEIREGLWRSIEQDSRAEEIYAEVYKHSVGGGYGEMMILPEYEADNSFDQVLRIKWIPNPLTVIRDPESTDPCGGDANWAMEGGRISTEKFEAEYPEMTASTFSMSRDSLGWHTEDQIRVVNYFERFAIEKTIALLSDGNVIDYTAKEKAVEEHLARTKTEAATVKQTRKVTAYKIRYARCDGTQILKGPIEYDWKRIPIVRMPGRYVNIEGKQKLQSLIRHSKDSQRAYNFQSSDALERSALMTKAPLLATAKMILGFEDLYASSNTAPRIFMPFNVDKDAVSTPGGGAPWRPPVIDPSMVAIGLAQKAAQDVQATTGYFDPALGNADDMNRVSGKALVTHTRRSDLGSHEFISNYGLALKLLATCGMDMMASVYDTERELRILGKDATDKMVTVNGQGDDGEVINDLKKGSYDCDITLGPAYQTQRQETLETLIDLVETIPAIAQLAPDLVAKAIDSPDTDEIVRRLRLGLIHQGIVQPTDSEKESMGPPPSPSPVQQAQAMREIANAHEDAAKAKLLIDKVNNSPLEIRRIVAEVVRTELDAMLKAQEIQKGHPEAFVAHLQTQLLNGTAPAAPPASGPQPQGQIPNG